MNFIDFSNPATWVAVFFFVFVALLIWKSVPKLITKALDDRAAEIQAELDAARKLREEAQSVLADYQRKAREAETEAESIVAQAKRESEAFAKETREKLTETLERRSKAADLKITQAEAKAVSEVREAAIDAAVKASEKLLADKAQGDKAADLIANSISQVKGRMN
ncbi:MAG: ATP synthase subunit b [Rhodomicrobium sp.]|nr:MAG: ATP synthase subunit b [Rhodomicrobium sp.]